MRWIEPGAEAPKPNICMFCESRPLDGRLLDTGRNYLYDTIPQSPLAGRRLVCEPCIVNMGRFAGMLGVAEAEQLQADLAVASTARAELARRVEDLEVGHMEAFRELVERRTFVKPGPKGPRSAKPTATPVA